MTTKHIAHGGWIGSDTCMEEGQPWIRPGAARYIESMLPEGANVFEFGSGASTIWLVRMGCSVTSVELDHDWYMQIVEWLKREGLEDRARMLNFSPANPLNTRDSVDFILHSDDSIYDLILIDGRARNRSVGNARSKVKIGGILCLDDIERDEYAVGLRLLDTWTGFSWGDEGKMTGVFHREKESDVGRVELPCEDA